MKTCPNCHAQLDDNAIFCTACGTQFGAVPPQQNAIPPQQNAIPPQQNAVPPQPAFAPAALVNKNWTEKIKICTIKTKTQTESERE